MPCPYNARFLALDPSLTKGWRGEKTRALLPLSIACDGEGVGGEELQIDS